jgi:hypothetical protein
LIVIPAWKPGFFLIKKPAMEIAGMCLPLKPQKESVYKLHGPLLQFFHVSQPGTDVRVSDGFSTSSILNSKF